MLTKIVKCTFCHQEFETPVDKNGVKIYSRCKEHRNMTLAEAQAERMKNVSLYFVNSMSKRSKLDNFTYFENGMWISYKVNPITFEKVEVCRDKCEQTCVNMKKLLLAIDN